MTVKRVGIPIDDFTRRLPSHGGWSRTSMPRGPNGRGRCRQCGHEVPKGSRTFCSKKCVDTWRATTDPGYQRRLVFERDQGVCRLCGLDTEQLERDYLAALDAVYDADPCINERTRRYSRPRYHGYHADFQYQYGGYGEVKARLAALGFVPGQSLWEMDHTVPVVEGGGACGINNLRTLCRPCHARETRALHQRLAEERRKRRRG